MKVAFGSFTFDSAARVLLDEDRPVHLSPKAFDVLQLLLERRPDVVRKEEIQAKIWPDTFVGDAALSVVIAEIRRAVRDGARTPEQIRTVHRVGYAFCGKAVEASPRPRTEGSPRCWLTLGDRAFALSEGDNVIGRDPQCAVWLDEPGVSRRHASMVVDSRGVTIEDLGSKNGTFVGGRRLTAARQLQDGDDVRFGTTGMKLRLWSDAQPPETVRLPRKRQR
jgi:DNA-binding winged helix-turn-helix (wHTH) protein